MELESNFLQFLFGWFHYFHTITKGLVQSVSPPAEWNSNLTKSIIRVHVVIKALFSPALHLDTGSIAVAGEHFKVANGHHRLHRGQRACSTNVPALERA